MYAIFYDVYDKVIMINNVNDMCLRHLGCLCNILVINTAYMLLTYHLNMRYTALTFLLYVGCKYDLYMIYTANVGRKYDENGIYIYKCLMFMHGVGHIYCMYKVYLKCIHKHGDDLVEIIIGTLA